MILLLAVAASQLLLVSAVCPHAEPGLKHWSHASTWPHGKPRQHASVVISTPVLLDESPPELHHIEITGSGRLVWSPSVNITVKTKYIYIHGRMDIGSEACPYTANGRIILTGRRGEFHLKDHLGMAIGDKVVVVGDGGVIEVHGQKKLSWTKLTRTLPKLTARNGLLYDHKASQYYQTDESYEHGIVAYIFHMGAHNRPVVKAFGSFELFSSWQAAQERAKMVQFIHNVTESDVLLLSVHSSLNAGSGDISAIYDAFETLAFGNVTGSSILRSVKAHDAYTAVVQKGQTNAVAEDRQSFHATGDKLKSAASIFLQGQKVKFGAESYIDTKASYKNYVDFRAVNYNGAFPKLRMIDDVSTWRTGDRLVLTSTDYDWQQAEEATVVECSDCSNKEIRVDLEARYSHWGRMVDHAVDERGEVALLSRNILIEGEVEPACVPSNGNCAHQTRDTFGGHFKFLKGATVHIEGAELYHMGQQTDIGRYPLHFHMCFDMRNQTQPPYVRENSIHDTFSRCVTVHGSHGVMVKDNVCYKSLGHSYFIEDGGERETTFDGNLAAGTMKGTLTSSDSQPASFWITSPLTRMRNNVAAGGEGFGIWYIFPTHPIGPSADKGFLQDGEADHTAYLEFDNNVAHSNLNAGLFADKRLKVDVSAAEGQFYFPKENPLDAKSADKKVDIYRLTAYKNGYQNAWFRGGWFHLRKASLSDSSKSITFARSSSQEQFLSESVLVGDSDNLGEPAVNWTRSLPIWYDRNEPHQGFTFYDGPVWAENVWFNGFKTTSLYKAGALTFERDNAFSSSASSGVRHALFGFVDGETTGNRVYDGDEGIHGFKRLDGDKGATFRDYDGSVTGSHVTTVVKPWPFYVDNRCTYRPNWNMAICPHTYGKIKVGGLTDKDKVNNVPVMVRDDIPEVNETMTALHSADFMVILGGSKTYTLHWTNFVPAKFGIYSSGFQKGKHVRFGVCLPRDATFDLYTYAPSYLPTLAKWIPASSLADLDSALNDGKKYYHDKQTGLLYLKFVNLYERLDNETKDCPHNSCPMVQVTVHGGNRHDADCRSRRYPHVRSHDGWGAGPTKPFLNRIPVDGGFGPWTHWGPCSLSCGGGHQRRARACDSPLPANGGSDCPGAVLETRDCSTQHCPIDGGFTSWSAWTACHKVSGCQGYKKRSRACTGPTPNYGGLYCHGSDEEVDNCHVC